MNNETLTLEQIQKTCHFDENDKVWVSPDGMHRYDPYDGEELIQAPNSDSFDDVSLLVLRRRYGYIKGTEMFNERRKGGK